MSWDQIFTKILIFHSRKIAYVEKNNVEIIYTIAA